MAPKLTQILGCFEKVDRVVATYAQFQFDRCPVKYQSARGILLMRQGEQGYLEALGPVEARRLPAKRQEALLYIEQYLLKLRETDGDRD